MNSFSAAIATAAIAATAISLTHFLVACWSIPTSFSMSAFKMEVMLEGCMSEPNKYELSGVSLLEYSADVCKKFCTSSLT